MSLVKSLVKNSKGSVPSQDQQNKKLSTESSEEIVSENSENLVVEG